MSTNPPKITPLNPPKIHQHCIKCRSWKALFCQIVFCIDVLLICWSVLEANLGPCWRHFRSEYRDPNYELWGGRFCWVYVLFRIFGRPSPLLAPFRFDSIVFGAPFWKFFSKYGASGIRVSYLAIKICLKCRVASRIIVSPH